MIFKNCNSSVCELMSSLSRTNRMTVIDLSSDTCLATEAGDACAISHTRAAIEQGSAAIKRGPGAEDSGCPWAPLRLRRLRVVEVEVGPEAVVARI